MFRPTLPSTLTGCRVTWPLPPPTSTLAPAPTPTVAEAVAATIDTLGLAPCEGSGQVKAGGNKHQALLSGVLLGDVRVLARMIVTLDESGCTLKLAVRAPTKDVAELIMSCVT